MKLLKIAGIAVVAVIALAVLGVNLAFAQKPGPTDTPWWDSMREQMQSGGMMGNWESMQQMHNQMAQNGGMGAMHEWMHQEGGVHETVWNTIAEKLGLTSDELTAQMQDGKTLAKIAEEKDVSTQDLADIMQSNMEAGLAQAVKDGKLTQAQADLILKRMEGQYQWMIENMGAGMMGPGRRGGGMMGPGAGGCHNYNTPPTQDDTSL